MPDHLRIRAMSPDDAREVATWRYAGPWSVYDGQPDDGEPDTAGYWAVVDGDDVLVGFYCTGVEARVPGLSEQPGTVDVGVGMRPDLVGVGNGRRFAEAVMAHCRDRTEAVLARAVVKEWNERSVRLAAGMGLERVGTHECVQGGQVATYAVLQGPLGPGEWTNRAVR
jgi:RimJ/RimL family protein N-acetyltransferase